MSEDKKQRKRLRRRMKAIEAQAAYERKLREPPAPPKPQPKDVEIIDVPGLVKASVPRNEKLETVIECARFITNYGGLF